MVRLPVSDGPCFFIHGDKLIWLDKEGKPAGKEETVTVDAKADPKRVKFTQQGEDGKERVLREGIYSLEKIPSQQKGEAAVEVWTIHLALDGKPVPRQFMELNKPAKGNDGTEWLMSRPKIQTR